MGVFDIFKKKRDMDDGGNAAPEAVDLFRAKGVQAFDALDRSQLEAALAWAFDHTAAYGRALGKHGRPIESRHSLPADPDELALALAIALAAQYLRKDVKMVEHLRVAYVRLSHFVEVDPDAVADLPANNTDFAQELLARSESLTDADREELEAFAARLEAATDIQEDCLGQIEARFEDLKTKLNAFFGREMFADAKTPDAPDAAAPPPSAPEDDEGGTVQ